MPHGSEAMKGLMMDLLSDVELLKREHSVDAKMTVTKKISDYFNDGSFNERERNLAEQVIRMLASDTEERIRMVVSETLKQCNHLPRDIALTLARSTTEVALPVLQFSKVFTDQDLIQIISAFKDVARWQAIAKREMVSGSVSQALVNTNDSSVVATLLNNEGASLDQKSYEQVLERMGNQGNLVQLLVEKGNLPLSVVNKLTGFVSGNLKKSLEDRYPALKSNDGRIKHVVKAVDEAFTESSEHVVLAFLSNKTRHDEVEELVDHLEKNDGLTPSLLLRALCKGDLQLFYSGIARRAKVPLENVQRLLMDKGGRGFQVLYEKAGMPQQMFEGAKVIFGFALDEVIKETIQKPGYADRIIARIIDEGHDSLLLNMRYLMVLINSQDAPSSGTVH